MRAQRVQTMQRNLLTMRWQDALVGAPKPLDSESFRISLNWGPESFRIHNGDGSDERLRALVIAEDGTVFHSSEEAAEHDAEEAAEQDSVFSIISSIFKAFTSATTPVYVAAAKPKMLEMAQENADDCTHHADKSVGTTKGPVIINTQFKPMTPQQEIDFALNARSFGEVDIGVPSILGSGTDFVTDAFTSNDKGVGFTTNTKISKVTFAEAAKPISLGILPQAKNDSLFAKPSTMDFMHPSASNASFSDLAGPTPPYLH